MTQAHTPLIGITPDELDARIERALTRALTRAHSYRDGRTAEASRPTKEWLTVREALVFLGISKATLQRYRSTGRVPYSKVGSNVFIKREDLDALLEAAVVRGGQAR